MGLHGVRKMTLVLGWDLPLLFRHLHRLRRRLSAAPRGLPPRLPYARVLRGRPLGLPVRPSLGRHGRRINLGWVGLFDALLNDSS